MLVLGSRFNETPVMSLQTGTRLAQTSRPIIDPANLMIKAFEVDGPLLSERPAFIRINDIREIAQIGMIIDDNDELIGLDDVIAIKKLYDIDFNLVGMLVVDERKHKLGKVEDFTVETSSFVIQQLHVKRGLIKGFNDTGLLVNRSQIIEITDNEIIVRSTAQKAFAEPVIEATRHDYVNPFRQPKPHAEPKSASTTD